MSSFLRGVILIVSGALLAGCASSGSYELDERSTAVTVAQALGEPDQRSATIDFSEYRIGPSDRIAVSVFGADDLAKEGVVDAAGNFAMPLIGSVPAGGKRPEQLSEEIAALLAGRYVKNPRVTVTVREARSNTFTVDGSVRSPGVYPIVGKLSLQQAIATAKGANEYANVNNVVIFRTVNNQKMAALFSLKDIRSGRDPDPEIYGNDIVVVGENAFKRFIRDVTSTLPSLGTFVPVI